MKTKNPDSAIEIHRKYMLEKENIPLGDGTGLPLVKALLELNKYQNHGESPLVEVVIMSRNSLKTGYLLPQFQQ